MPFNISQILGGWKKKASSKGESHSHRSRLTLPRSGAGSDAPRFANEIRPKDVPPGKKSDFPGKSDFEEGGAKIQPKGESDLAWELIRSPHISEKSTTQGDGKYIFKVAGSATKGTLKKAVEDRYDVKVSSVHMLNMPSKKRRRGATIGLKAGFKKAIVALKAGQTISEF